MMQTALATLAHRTDLVDLATFDNHRAAELFCVTLSEHGIEASIYDEGDLQMFVFLTKLRANVKVQVSEDDYAEAVTCLIEFEQQNPQLQPFIYSCPDCGSFAVEHPQFSRKFITPQFLEWLSNLGLFPKQCYCRKWPCHLAEGTQHADQPAASGMESGHLRSSSRLSSTSSNPRTP